ncbi:MAG: putative maltokinase, partial [Chloroflexota bacterium]
GPGELAVPTMSLSGEWANLFKLRVRPALESALLNYIQQRRWFASKARHVHSAEILDIIAVPYNAETAYLIPTELEYTDGEPEVYLVPLAFASEENAAKIISNSPDAVIARLKPRGKDTETTSVLYDALSEPDFATALLKSISQRRQFRGKNGRVTCFPTRAFRRLRGSAVDSLTPSLSRAEQSNTSVMFGDRFMLKIFRKMEEGISTELELGRFLTEKEPFRNTPPVAGALEYQGKGEVEPVTMGILHGYVSNEGNAWHYTLDELAHYFERILAHPEVETPPQLTGPLLEISEREVPQALVETVGSYLASARLLGQRTGELHLALASAMVDVAFTPEPFSVTYQRSLYHTMRGFAYQVLQLLGQRRGDLPKDAVPAAEAVLARQDDIISCFQNVTRHKINGMRIRCHGDYHLGQVLYTGSDFVIIDFEGEPARHLGERRIKRSPLRDVAGMLRSFYYAAFVALRNWTTTVPRPEDIPMLENWTRVWNLWVSGAFLKSYLDLVSDVPILPSTREDTKTLLNAYLLEKAVYEVNYELNNRPDWVKLPLQGILHILDSEV